MCERTSAMFAIRACRAFCIKNYDAYPRTDSQSESCDWFSPKDLVAHLSTDHIISLSWQGLPYEISIFPRKSRFSECGMPGAATTVVDMANQVFYFIYIRQALGSRTQASEIFLKIIFYIDAQNGDSRILSGPVRCSYSKMLENAGLISQQNYFLFFITFCLSILGEQTVPVFSNKFLRKH